jgi:hypothetical protein
VHTPESCAFERGMDIRPGRQKRAQGWRNGRHLDTGLRVKVPLAAPACVRTLRLLCLEWEEGGGVSNEWECCPSDQSIRLSLFYFYFLFGGGYVLVGPSFRGPRSGRVVVRGSYDGSGDVGEVTIPPLVSGTCRRRVPVAIFLQAMMVYHIPPALRSTCLPAFMLSHCSLE